MIRPAGFNHEIPLTVAQWLDLAPRLLSLAISGSDIQRDHAVAGNFRERHIFYQIFLDPLARERVGRPAVAFKVLVEP